MNVLGTPQLARILHPFIGVAMFLAFMLMFLRYWKHNPVNRDDLLWAKNIHKIAMNEEVGDTGRYNFGQKCVFWAAIISLLLLLASGIVIWRPYFAGAFPIPLIRLALLVHSVSAVGLIIVIMVHIYAALWVKGTLTAMVEGWVTPIWAKSITRAGIALFVNSRANRHNRINVPDDYSHHPARTAGEERQNNGGYDSAVTFPVLKIYIAAAPRVCASWRRKIRWAAICASPLLLPKRRRSCCTTIP